jgi:propionyl-CoA carboxylase alpha chain
MELRVYAEDPMNDFLPSVGHLCLSIAGWRRNSWITVLNKAWIFYLLRSCCYKLITGETREEAIQIMIKAIEEYQVEGVQTTLLLGNLF